MSVQCLDRRSDILRSSFLCCWCVVAGKLKISPTGEIIRTTGTIRPVLFFRLNRCVLVGECGCDDSLCVTVARSLSKMKKISGGDPPNRPPTRGQAERLKPAGLKAGQGRRSRPDAGADAPGRSATTSGLRPTTLEKNLFFGCFVKRCFEWCSVERANCRYGTVFVKSLGLSPLPTFSLALCNVCCLV